MTFLGARHIVPLIVVATDLPTLVSAFQEFGFIYVTLDLEGYRSGKLNQVLDRATLNVKA